MPADVMVEVRVEELPASMVRPALAALSDGVVGLLSGVAHGEPEVFATPRRLAVHVPEVAEGRPLVEREVTGPPADRAFVDGEPTKAALGFARGRGVDPSALRVVEGPRGPVVAVTVQEGGERTADLLAAGLEGVILGLPFAKAMEWGEGGIRFGRPLHEVSALYGGEIVQTTVGGIGTGNRTHGHRLAQSPSFHFHTHREWLEGLRSRRVEPDLAARAARIQALLDEAAETLEADPIDDPALLEEVLHLVEWPVLVLGTFDEDLLALPPRLLVQSMKQHQRYFPVHREGRLTHHFVVISNNPWGDAALIAEGNARVLRARFYDARFFFAEDSKKRLEAHAEALGRMRWIRGLGTMAEKQARVARLAARLAPLTGADPGLTARAGALCKADLTTQMVGEFPELQGHMGHLYARAEGAPEVVARALEEHYLPRFADDTLPGTAEGAALALADRLDTLVGCFALGMVPKGGGDPQGLRRAASGVLRILQERSLPIPLDALVQEAVATWAEGLPDEAEPERLDLGPKRIERLVAFALSRFKAAMAAEGVTTDLVDAVVAVTAPDPRILRGKILALAGLAGGDEFEPILQTFKRVLNISRGARHEPPDRAALDPAEAELARSIDRVAEQVRAQTEAMDFEAALHGMLALRAPVSAFFDAVLVDDPDPAVKARRLGLLLEAAGVFRHLADFSRISTR